MEIKIWQALVSYNRVCNNIKHHKAKNRDKENVVNTRMQSII